MEYLEEIKKKFEVPIIGDIRTFKDIFAMLMELSRKQRFTLIVDEFQEFYNINPAIYSEIQRLWDLNKNESKLNLIFVGSVVRHGIIYSSAGIVFTKSMKKQIMLCALAARRRQRRT